MNIGIFGGTFDPFHNGHLSIIRGCADSGFFEKIYIVPSFNPPHKGRSGLSAFSYRYEMTKLAIENIKSKTKIILSDIETEEDGFSYTLNTVRKINREILKNSNLYLICGSDVLYDVKKWHKPDKLLKEIGLYVFTRPGFDDENLQIHTKSVIEDYNAKIYFSKLKMPDISSNNIRKTLNSDILSAKSDLQDNIYDFIISNRIYDDEYSLKNLDDKTVKLLTSYEKILRRQLTPKRLIHSLNTMREALKLAKIHSADPVKAAITGILHDCAKYNGSGELYRIMEANGKAENIAENECKIPDKILHAYHGRVFAREIYKIKDMEILDSIYYHTTSRENPSLIEKIVFVADKIEPARNFPRIDKIRQIAYKNLDEGYFECLKDIIKVLEKNKLFIHCDTLKAYEFIKSVKSERRF